MNEEVNVPNNKEIDQALKEFEAKSGAPQSENSQPNSNTSDVPQREVSGIKFETVSYKSKFDGEVDAPKMVKLVMKLSGGAIKDQKQAEYVLFGLVIVIVGVSLYFFFS